MEREKLAEEGEQPKVRIQSFTPEWQESTIDCIGEVRRIQYNDSTGFVKAIYKEGIEKNFQRFAYEDFFIALDPEAKQVVGNIGLRFVKEKADQTRIGQLRRFNVRPSFEGREIGSRLLKHSLDFARANHYKEIYLTTASDQEHKKAVGMYERRGFQKIDVDSIDDKDIRDVLVGGKDIGEYYKSGKGLIYKLELEKNKTEK